MRELHRDGITQIVVTHEMRFAREAADRIVFMSDGRIVEQGKPEIMFTEPSDPLTRQNESSAAPAAGTSSATTDRSTPTRT